MWEGIRDGWIQLDTRASGVINIYDPRLTYSLITPRWELFMFGFWCVWKALVWHSVVRPVNWRTCEAQP
jgi:hypothetical protein